MEWALYFASRGIPVFALQDARKPGTLPGGAKDWSKSPRGRCADCKTKGCRFADCGHHLCHGSHGATTDPDLIREMWAKHPRANVGGATGCAAGILVVEADVAHVFKNLDGTTERVVDGRETLAAAIAENGDDWPTTQTNLSGSDGPHYVFRYPDRPRSDGSEWGNTVGGTAKDIVCEAVDSRGRGGFVVLPGSSSNKGRYRVQTVAAFAPVPEWVLRRIDKAPAAQRPVPAVRTLSADGTPFVSTGSRAQDSARRRFNSALAKLRTTTSYRNEALNRASHDIAGIVYHPQSGITETEALTAIWDAAVTCGYVAKDGEQAARASMNSGWTSGLAKPHPWPLPERPWVRPPIHHETVATIRKAVLDGTFDREDAVTTFGLDDEQIAYMGLDDLVAQRARMAAEGVEYDETTVPAPAPADRAQEADTASEPTGQTPAAENPAAQPKFERPRVYAPTRGRDLAELAAETRGAWSFAQSVRPSVFRHGPEVTVVAEGELVPLGPASLADRMAQDVEFFEMKAAPKAKKGEEQQPPEEVPAYPPSLVVSAILEAPQQVEGLREVLRVSRTPYFDADGVLISTPGYNPKTRIFYAPVPGVVIREIPTRPAYEDVARALDLIATMIQDFVFVTPADRAHFYAFALTPLVSAMVYGPGPIIAFDSANNREGKGLLLRCGLAPLMGGDYRINSAPTNAEEWEKKIGSVLRRGPQVAVFDNLNIKADAAPLAAATTAHPTYNPRILGKSEDAELPVPSCWVITGKNVSASTEIAERMLRVRIDSGVEHPGRRSGFAIPNLAGWVKRNQGDLVRAWCILIAAWVAAGKPIADDLPAFGGFEEWTETVGSILAFHGITDLLGNRDDVTETADDEDAAWRGLFRAWREEDADKSTNRRELSQILDLITGWEAALGNEGGVVIGGKPTPVDMARFSRADSPIDLGGGAMHSQVTRLGAALKHHVGRVFDGYKLTKGRPGGKTVYELVKVA